MADTPQAFAIDAAEGVEVHLDDSSEDEKFDLVVLKQGQELESHPGLTAETLAGASSEHFTISTVDPPTAPPEVDDHEDAE